MNRTTVNSMCYLVNDEFNDEFTAGLSSFIPAHGPQPSSLQHVSSVDANFE